MLAQKLNITIAQGSTFRQSFLIRAGTAPIDLTGWTARGQIRRTVRDQTVLASFVTEVNGSQGQILISIPAAVSSAIVARRGVYDIEIQAPSNGDTYRIVEGEVTFIPEVTR